MPLYIRDNDVNAMAIELQKLTNAPSKTEAVRQALTEQLHSARGKMTLTEKIRELQDRARKLGTPNRDFDMKVFSDEMWEDD